MWKAKETLLNRQLRAEYPVDDSAEAGAKNTLRHSRPSSANKNVILIINGMATRVGFLRANLASLLTPGTGTQGWQSCPPEAVLRHFAAFVSFPISVSCLSFRYLCLLFLIICHLLLLSYSCETDGRQTAAP